MTNPRSGRTRRVLQGGNVLVYLAAILVIAVVVNYFSGVRSLRMQIDATKTRAYSLSEQTQRLLGDLDGEWRIALVMVRDGVDPAMARQIDEVLARYTATAPNISLVQVDPTDPRSLGDYELLLGDLRALYQDLMDEYDTALDEGADAFAALQAFAQVQSGMLAQAVGMLPAGSGKRAAVEQRVGLLALLAEQGGQVLDEIDRARRIDGGQPIPDYETARSILAEALSQWANELFVIGREMRSWNEQSETAAVIREYVTATAPDYEAMAQRLATAADPLRRLPPLEIADIGRQLQTGDTAIVIGPDRAAVIPSPQLFPAINLRQQRDGKVRDDRRFRGEQLISAAIRSLQIEHMPLVVFVHNEQESLLTPRDRQSDLVGLATALRTARFDVDEWIVAKGDRPQPAEGQPAVWVVVPPAPGPAIETGPQTQELVTAVTDLLADGEATLVSLYPSVLPKYGQPDPWMAVLAEFGLGADTGRVLFEAVRVSETQRSLVRGQALQSFEADHPIAAAINGQQTYLGTPVVLEHSTPPAGVTHDVVVTVEPSESRWLERDWLRTLAQPGEPPSGDPITDPLPLVIAAQRPDPIDSGEQPMLVVGSGGWMLSNVADLVVNVDSGRTALVNPGNYELAMASIAWLAGMEELIAPSPLSQQIARIDGLDDRARWRYVWALLGGLPAACLMLGTGVWFMRRV